VFRYLALLWNPAEEASSRVAAQYAQQLQHSHLGWTPVLSRHGIAVFVTGTKRGSCRTYPLGNGVVLGTLFRLSDTVQGRFDLTLDPEQRAAILQFGCRELVNSYWGRYVAFLYDARTNEKLVFRDPTGGMPCSLVESNGVQICCSLFEDCL